MEKVRLVEIRSTAALMAGASELVEGTLVDRGMSPLESSVALERCGDDRKGGGLQHAGREAGVDAGARGLGGEDAGFGFEHFVPAGIGFGFARAFLSEFEEDFVVTEFGGVEGVVEGGEFGVGGVGGEDRESLARAEFDHGGDEEAVEGIADFAFANEGAEGVGVRILVDAAEAAATAGEDASNLSEVCRFVTGDVGHGFDPAGEPFAGPAGHHVHGVVGGFLFEEGVIDEEGDGVLEDGVRPFGRCN